MTYRTHPLALKTKLEPALTPLAADGTPPILAYDGHCDPAGNRAMAERLAVPVLASLR